MGYFSNGAEGDTYEAKYCARCVHGQNEPHGPYDCPVLALHLLYNYDQFKTEEPGPTIRHILTWLIPKAKDGPWNDKCLMFSELPGGKAPQLSGNPG